MKPLLVLLIVFVTILSASRFLLGSYKPALAGRIAMSAMLVFTAMGHFVFTKGMALMLPAFIPFQYSVVYMTGIIEIAAAIGILIPNIRIIIAYLLIAFFILILPANINSAIEQVDFQNANLEGYGLSYLWFRIPLQLFFICWVYMSAIDSKYRFQ